MQFYCLEYSTTKKYGFTSRWLFSNANLKWPCTPLVFLSYYGFPVFPPCAQKVYLEYSRFGINLHNYIKKPITQMLTLEKGVLKRRIYIWRHQTGASIDIFPPLEKVYPTKYRLAKSHSSHSESHTLMLLVWKWILGSQGQPSRLSPVMAMLIISSFKK